MTGKDYFPKIQDASEADQEELHFTCPQCGGSRLFLRQEALVEVQAVYPDDDVEYDDVYADEDLGYECRDCKYVLKDDDGDRVWSRGNLAAWLVANCEQTGLTP